MRSATSSGKCKTLCNSSNSPGIVCTVGVEAAAVDVVPANGVSFDSAIENSFHDTHKKEKHKISKLKPTNYLFECNKNLEWNEIKSK